MTTSGANDVEHRIAHLAIRTLRVLRGATSEATSSTVYCPIQEKAVAVGECEICARFHAVGEEPTAGTAVFCEVETSVPSPDEEAVLRDAAGGPPDPLTPLSSIMTKDVLCVDPTGLVSDLREFLVTHQVGAVPVVDEAGKPIGMVLRGDVFAAEHHLNDPTPPRPRTAQEIMSTVVLALHESSNIGQAAALMAFERVHHLPVVSDAGTVVGVLSSLDVLRWFSRRSGYFIPDATKPPAR